MQAKEARRARNQRYEQKKRAEKEATQREALKLLQVNTQLLQNIQQLQLQVECLQGQQRADKEQAWQYQQQLQILQSALENLLAKLPHNSPIRRPLESEITRGMSNEEIRQRFSLSPTTIRRIEKERNRIVTTTRRKFYENYVAKAKQRPGGYVFSRNFVVKNFLRRRHYRRSWQNRQRLRRSRFDSLAAKRGMVLNEGS